MTCDICWQIPQSPKKHSYLVQLSNDAGEALDIVVQTPCTHDMQEWVTEQARLGRLPIRDPKVINIDAKAAAHIPIVDPDPVN